MERKEDPTDVRVPEHLVWCVRGEMFRFRIVSHPRRGALPWFWDRMRVKETGPGIAEVRPLEDGPGLSLKFRAT